MNAGVNFLYEVQNDSFVHQALYRVHTGDSPPPPPLPVAFTPWMLEDTSDLLAGYHLFVHNMRSIMGPFERLGVQMSNDPSVIGDVLRYMEQGRTEAHTHFKSRRLIWQKDG
jgi:hypothetical protein